MKKIDLNLFGIVASLFCSISCIFISTVNIIYIFSAVNLVALIISIISTIIICVCLYLYTIKRKKN